MIYLCINLETALLVNFQSRKNLYHAKTCVIQKQTQLPTFESKKKKPQTSECTEKSEKYWDFWLFPSTVVFGKHAFFL